MYSTYCTYCEISMIETRACKLDNQFAPNSLLTFFQLLPFFSLHSDVFERRVGVVEQNASQLGPATTRKIRQLVGRHLSYTYTQQPLRTRGRKAVEMFVL